jgi:hypothetical protein
MAGVRIADLLLPGVGVRVGQLLPTDVEGNVTRIKLLKRQMYGRANFDLLRRRILLSP